MRLRFLLVFPVLLALGAARTPMVERCADHDGDGRLAGRRCASAVDCDDRDRWTYTGARQRPDGKNNDCGHPSWPFLAGTNEFDDDQDGFDEVVGDCNDGDGSIHPNTEEICNGFDDDCNGFIDDGATCATACVVATLPAGSIRVTNDPALSGAPKMVWTGTEYGLVWEDLRAGNFGNEVFFTRLDRSGRKLVGDIRVTDAKGPSYEPQLVWTGAGFGVSWYVPFIQIFFNQIDPEGGLVGPSIPVTGSKDGYGTRVAWDGTNYAVTWLQVSAIEQSKVSFARFTGTGGYLGTTTLASGVSSGLENSPGIVFGGGSYAVVWVDERAGSRVLGFARIDRDATVLNEQFVTSGQSSPSQPRLFWTGADYGIFWQDSDAGAPQLRYARIDGAGNVLTPGHPVGITSANAIAWTGSEFGIVHTCGEGLCYSRRGVNGETIGNSAGLPGLSGAPRGAQLVWNGSGFGLVWTATAESQNDEIYFAGITCASGGGDPGGGDPGGGDPGGGDPGGGDPGGGDPGGGDPGGGDPGGGDPGGGDPGGGDPGGGDPGGGDPGGGDPGGGDPGGGDPGGGDPGGGDPGGGDPGGGDPGGGDPGGGDPGGGDPGGGDPGGGDPGGGDPGGGDPGGGDPGGADDGVYLSITVDQFFGGLKRHQDLLHWSATAGANSLAAFLPTHAGLDAIDVQANGDLLFSVEATAGVTHSGGFLVLDPTTIYRYQRASGVIENEVNWSGTTPIGDVVALDVRADGLVAFALAETRGVHDATGYQVLLPGNVYFYDPARQSIALGIDLRARGLGEVDAIDLLDGGRAIAFSVAVDRAIQSPGGVILLRQQSAYRLDLETGAVTIELDGLVMGLGSLDALDLGPGAI